MIVILSLKLTSISHVPFIKWLYIHMRPLYRMAMLFIIIGRSFEKLKIFHFDHVISRIYWFNLTMIIIFPLIILNDWLWLLIWWIFIIIIAGASPPLSRWLININGCWTSTESLRISSSLIYRYNNALLWLPKSLTVGLLHVLPSIFDEAHSTTHMYRSKMVCSDWLNLKLQFIAIALIWLRRWLLLICC